MAVLKLNKPSDLSQRKSLDPRREYLAGGYLSTGLGNLIASGGAALSESSDDLIKEFGGGIYDRMCRDPKIAKCVKLLKISTLGDGVEFLPNLSDNHPEYQKSRRVADFCAFAVSDMKKPLKAVLEQMLDAIKYGHKIGEIVFKNKYSAEFGGTKLIVDSIKTKPFGLARFVVDDSYNILGIVGVNNIGRQANGTINEFTRLDDTNVVVEGDVAYVIAEDGSKNEFTNIDKFMVMTLDAKDEDPRGTSLLRAAFNFWHIKNEVIPEYLRYLLTCSIPLLVGFTPVEEADNSNNNILKNPDGSMQRGTDGNPIRINPVEAMREALIMARNSTSLALKGGSMVKEIGAAGSGIPFTKAFEVFDSQMEMSILLQTLATSESKFNTRAASETHMTVLDQLIFDLKEKVADMLTSQLLKKLIKYNLGEEWLKYLPIVTLGDTERRNFVADATAIAALYAAGYLSEDQKRACDAMLQLPIRDNQFENITPDEVMRYSTAVLEQADLEANVKKTRESTNFERIKQISELHKVLETATDAKVIATINKFISDSLEAIEADNFNDDASRIVDTFMRAKIRAKNLLNPPGVGDVDRVDYPTGVDTNIKLPAPSSGSSSDVNAPYISVKSKPTSI